MANRIANSRPSACCAPSERGVTLVAVLVMVAVSVVMMGKATTHWEGLLEREREAELIFRGEEYKKALETFQRQNRRLPTKLEELIKTKPRSIRRLYKDPFNPDGDWVIIPAGSKPKTAASSAEEKWKKLVQRTGPPISQDRRSAGPGQKSRQQLKGGFIGGVRSGVERKSLRSYMGSEQSQDWLFMAEIKAPARKKRAGKRARADRSSGRRGSRSNVRGGSGRSPFGSPAERLERARRNRARRGARRGGDSP